jgi:O-antigen ligase
MLKRIVLFYISIRTVLLAFYNVSPIPGIRVTDLVGFLFPLIILVMYIGEENNALKLKKYQQFYFYLICFVLVSYSIKLIFYEVEFIGIAKSIVKILTGFIVFILFPKIFKNEDDVKKLLNAFLISTIFPAMQIFGQYIFGRGFLGLKTNIISEDVQLYTGVYGNHGVFGIISWMGPLCIITMMAFLKKTDRRKSIFGLLFVLYLAIGIMTLSRTIVILMLVVTMGMFAILLKRKNYGLILVFASLISIYILYTPMFKQSYQGLLARSAGEIEVLRGNRELRYSLHGRINRWDNVVNIFLADYSLEQQLFGTDLQIGPHGDYITWLVHFGWIGIALYLLLIIKLIYKTWKYRRKTKDSFLKHYGTTALTGLIVWVIMAITTNPSFMPDFSYFVMGNVSIFLSLSLKKQTMLRRNAG